MSFEIWLFAIKKFAQSYEVAQIIFENLPLDEKEKLWKEYEEYLKSN